VLDQVEAADFVLAICTAAYRRRFEKKEKAGKGLGVKFEGAVITTDIYDNDSNNARFIPVWPDHEPEDHRPTILRPVTFYRLMQGYDDLYRRLTGQPAIVAPATAPTTRKLAPITVPAPPAAKPSIGAASAVRTAAIWNVPLSRNEYFTGREELLAALDKKLKSNSGPAAVTQAIAGLGGVGKTQLALEYAWRHADDYDVVWWVRAETAVESRSRGDLEKTDIKTTATLAQDYADLAAKLGLPEAKQPNVPETVKAVREWLQTNKRWLLIFDNVTKPEDLDEYLPTRAGHVLITSRHQEWAHRAGKLPIDLFERPDSVAFLLRRTNRTDPAGAGELAAALGDLPLALEQAAAYCDSTGKSFAAYLGLFNKQRAHLLKFGKPKDYPYEVASAWEMNFTALGKENAAAADLLNLIAFFAPERIPLNVIVEHAKELPKRLKKALAEEACCDGLVASLLRYSLVRADGGMLFVHRLVQEVVRDRMPEKTRKEWAERAVTLASNAFPYEVNDPATWAPTGEWLPHALASVDRALKERIAGRQCQYVLNGAGIFQRRRAAFAESRALLERALPIAEKVFGSDHSEVAAIVNNLGGVLLDLSDLPGAKKCRERAFAIGEKVHGPDHPKVATYVNNLGSVLHGLGDLPGAKKCFERALAIDEKVYGPDHPEVATDVNNLGLVLRALGDLPGAKKCFELALAIDEKVYGPDHPAVATDVNNLGGVLRGLSDLPGAKKCIERALAIDEKVYGPDHPNVAIRVNNLGGVLRALGDLPGAKERYERALKIVMKFLGPDHPNTKIARKNLERVEAEMRGK
jgi:tetratricopeptide (TPR) repeat protein